MFAHISSTRTWFSSIDLFLFIPALLLAIFGLLSMHSTNIHALFFERQLLWLSLAVVLYLIIQRFDYRFLRNTNVVMLIFTGVVFLLLLTFGLGSVVKGAKSWIDVGLFAIQPADPAKLALIILLAKYFSRRHIEIAQFKHIIVSGAYMGILFLLVVLQPDFGSAMMIAALWFGMVLSSGIPWKHILTLAVIGSIFSLCMWQFVFQDYQKARIMTFLNPLADTQGAGYNSQQSLIAIGSGEFLGKGVGLGTQSKLEFLPEYETDFIFAAFAEEWGFIGVIIVLLLFAIIVLRLLFMAWRAETNFEALFTIGAATLIAAETVMNIGMNVTILPVTGVALPFMSYGGSHLLIEFIMLGMANGMYKYAHVAHKDDLQREMLSP